MKIFITLCSCIAFSLISYAKKSESKLPFPKPEKILKNQMSYLYYNQSYVKLDREFEALDSKGVKITKGAFLQKLVSGNYIPLRISAHDALIYKLYKLPKNTDSAIGKIASQYAAIDLAHYKREGERYPTFEYTDLDGKTYNSANTKGKILVVKYWYVACGQCVKEIPELNILVDRYKSRDDVLFVSLATNTKSQLQDFLKTRTFDYKIVPVDSKYPLNSLNTNMAPTHFIVNKKGIIVKVVNDAAELTYNVDKEATK